MLRTPVYLSLAIAFTACRAVDEAPDVVDQEARDLWRTAMSGEDSELLALLTALADRQDVEAIAKTPEEGEISRLQEEDLADLEFVDGPPGDPANARGLSWLNAYACSSADLEILLSYPDQNTIFGSYDTYSRLFRGGNEAREAFLDGTSDRLTWDGALSASNLAYGAYSYDFISEMRRLRDADGEAAGWLVRNWMTREAALDNENKTFTQDYQLEAYIPAGDDMVFHFYPFWREMDLGSLGTSEGDVVAQTTFFLMKGLDRKAEKACAEGLPVVE